MSNKTTKTDLFNAILNGYPLTAEHKAFIEHEVELLAKRNSRKSEKPTKKQTENEGIKSDIIAVLFKATEPMTATSVGNALPTPISAQKASALLKQMVDTGSVVRSTIKRVSYFSLSTEEAEVVEEAED